MRNLHVPDPADRRPHTLRCARELRVKLLVEAGDPVQPSPDLLHEIAVAISEHCGYSILRSYRIAWNYSVEQVVAAFHRMCRENNLGSRGLSERSWKGWEGGEKLGPDYQDLVSRLFQTSPIRLGFAHDYMPAVDPEPEPARSTPLGDPGWGVDSVERQLIMAADESAQLGDHPSNVGPLTMDLLREDAQTLARKSANAPRLELFDSVLLLRDRVFACLDGRQRVSETRDLYFLAAAALGMLAEVTEDLGFTSQAMTHLRTGLLCAKEVNHPDLTAWLLTIQSGSTYWDGRPKQALDYARRGLDLAPKGTVAVWLSANEARAAAALGDQAGAANALERARTARDLVRPDELDTFYGGIMSFSPAKENYYASGTWISLEDGARTRQTAEASIRGYQSGPAQDRAWDNEATAHVNVALAEVLSDDLEAAQAALGRALELPSELRIRSFHEQLRRLHAQVTQARFDGSGPAATIRDQIEYHLSTTHPTLPPG
ncbi:MAG TPA: hypothetical protein VIR27_11935 [Mycobacteriales bacterium]